MSIIFFFIIISSCGVDYYTTASGGLGLTNATNSSGSGEDTVYAFPDSPQADRSLPTKGPRGPKATIGNPNNDSENMTDNKAFAAVYHINASDVPLTINLAQNDGSGGEDYEYNFMVDWGDGSSSQITSYNQTETTHSYAEAGVYTMIISGTMPGGRFGDSRLVSVTNLGEVGWKSLSRAFANSPI